MLEKTEGAINNVQSTDTGNKTQDENKQNKTQHRKLKRQKLTEKTITKDRYRSHIVVDAIPCK